MVRMCFFPKSLEEQLVKKLRQGYDQYLVREILKPSDKAQREVIVALCQDGRGDKTYHDNSYTIWYG